jgi:eukaryotic-like serine/threonine-protein kinase
VLQERYRILGRIASGAMGVVYRGERLVLGRPVAVKFLHPWIAAQKAFIGRFENEAKAMSRLTHPNCVSVIDFGVDGSPYLVMDFITGRTLRDVMQGGPLPARRALRIGQQLLAGLAHAHGQGIVHRDLKPENLILSAEPGQDEHLRILDFGLAKLRDGPAMTAGLAVGTPSYMSPEQTGGSGTADARTDLYTVGVLLFEVLTGQKPFRSENIAELILAHRESPPPRLREVAPSAGFSVELEAAIDKVLSKHPDDRFQTAVELSAALQATPELSHVREPGRRASLRKPESAKTTLDTISAVRRRLGPDLRAATTSAARELPPVRLGWIALGLALLILVAVGIGHGLRPSGHEPPAPPSVASAPTARPADEAVPARDARVTAPSAKPTPPTLAAAAVTPSNPPGEDPHIEEARRLVAEGKGPDAVALLEHFSEDHPDNADAPYLLALIDFDNRHFAEGLTAAGAAVRKDPANRSDGDLVRGVIRALGSDRVFREAQAFLRRLGRTAIPFVREAAQTDPDPKVRERAAEILGGRGGGFPPARAKTGLFKR